MKNNFSERCTFFRTQTQRCLTHLKVASILTMVICFHAKAANRPNNTSGDKSSFVGSIFLYASSIKGTVTDSKGSPLSGVTVKVEGDKAFTTTTEANGKFILASLPAGSYSITFSYVGFIKNTLPVILSEGEDRVINTTLSEETTALNTIVVIGYGTTKKKDLTGSVASVQMKDLDKSPVISTEQLLAGRVSGVQVSQNQSQPGAAFAIRIRGTNSINSGNSPLFVIDGYAGADFNSLNQNDVLSIDVLKDASATAIYGSRGANGVIIITTKRGNKGLPKISVDGYTGVQTVARRYDLMDAPQFATYLNTVTQEQNVLNNTNTALPYTAAQIAALGKGTDWQNEIFTSAPIGNYSVAFNGGDEESKHYLSFNYFNQKGVIEATSLNRAILRFNLDQRLSDKLKMGLSSQVSYSFQNAAAVNTTGGGNTTSVLWDAVRFNPALSPYDANGGYTVVNGPAGYVTPLGNSVAYINEAKNTNSQITLFANTFAEYEIIKGLKLRSSIGANYLIKNTESFLPTDLFAVAGLGSVSQRSTRDYNWLNENTLTYERTFNETHFLNVTGGFTYQHFYNKFFGTSVTNLSTDKLGPDNLSVGNPQPSTSFYGDNTLASYFLRANYRLMDKYLFTATMRADGSSRFGENNKWGYFPSGAFAWNISEENFLKDSKTISDLKLRTSYGVTGNQEIGSYNGVSQYVATAYPLGKVPTTNVGFYPVNIANPDLKWESTSSADIGLDLGLWANRVYITTDVYSKKTSNLLLFINIPVTSGYSSYLTNVGKVSNKGLEIAISTINIDNTDFKWNTNLNFSTNRNKVLDLGSNSQIFAGDLSGTVFRGGGNKSGILTVGSPIGSFYGNIFDGIWQSQQQISSSGTKQSVKPGDPIYRDLNGDGLLTGADRAIIGQALPKFTFGITNTFSYKRLSLNLFLQGVSGNKVFNENVYELENGVTTTNKLASVATESWNGEGSTNTLPRVSSVLRSSAGVVSDVLEDGSFLRVKTLTLSYAVSPAKLGRVFKAVSVYVTAQNLYTFTKYSGYDPEVNSFTEANSLSLGTDYNAYPNYRTFLAGVKFGF